VRPDIVFTARRVAVFVDGYFWHGCPIHHTRAVTNAEYWSDKVANNRDRDRRTTVALEADGWTVIRIWEHEDARTAAAQILAAIRLEGASRPIEHS
jgi:DNA mismatch endonuclease (patch repair protein)